MLIYDKNDKIWLGLVTKNNNSNNKKVKQKKTFGENITMVTLLLWGWFLDSCFGF